MKLTDSQWDADLTIEDRDFSLVHGGPLFQLLRRSRMADDAMEMVWRRVIVIALFCWLPLLVLTAFEGTFIGDSVAVPFLKDVQTHVRFLAAIPLLIGAETVVHRRFRSLVLQFLERDLIAKQDMPKFKAAIESAMRLRNSLSAEIILVVVVYLVGVMLVWRQYLALDLSTWYAFSAGDARSGTYAGMWYGYVSLPLFQFLLVRWYFRIFIWARFLWQVSRIDLQLIPTHPDRAGGLGFLSGTAYAFIPLLMAHGTLLAGLVADRIFFLNEKLPDFKLEVIVMIAFLLCLVQGPLLVFVGQLSAAKRKAKREYGKLAQDYVRQFDTKWLRGGVSADDQFMGSADIQSLSDLAGSYDIVQSMRVVLFSRQAILTFAGAIFAPIAPLALTMMPFEALLDRLFGVIF